MSIKLEREALRAKKRTTQLEAEVAALKEQLAKLAADNAKLAAELKKSRKATTSVPVTSLDD